MRRPADGGSRPGQRHRDLVPTDLRVAGMLGVHRGDVGQLVQRPRRGRARFRRELRGARRGHRGGLHRRVGVAAAGEKASGKVGILTLTTCWYAVLVGRAPR